ncbi:hypothetical protein D3C72_1030470 [compost metagenome]
MQRHQAQIAQAQIQRDHRHADRRKEFQHGGRQESDAQHLHGAHANALGRSLDAGQLGLPAAIQAQQAQALDAIGEVPAHPRQFPQLRASGRFGAPADQHHEERHQRCGEQQDQCNHPIDPGHSCQDQQRHHHHFGAHRQETTVVVLDRIAVMQHQLTQLAGAALPQPQRAMPEQAREDTLAQGQACSIGNVTGRSLGDTAQQGPHHQNHRQRGQHRQALGQRRALDQHLLHQPGDGGGLTDQQRTGHADAQRRQPLPSLRGAGQIGQPRGADTPQARRFVIPIRGVSGRFGSAQGSSQAAGGWTAL